MELLTKLNQYKRYKNAIKFLERNGFSRIGGGFSRNTYAKDDIVIKLTNFADDVSKWHENFKDIPFIHSNRNEYRHFKQIKNTILGNAVIPVLHFKALKNYSYNVMPRGDECPSFEYINNCVYIHDQTYQFEYDVLSKMFCDVHPCNLVLYKGRLRVCDYQFGLMNDPVLFPEFSNHFKEYEKWFLTLNK